VRKSTRLWVGGVIVAAVAATGAVAAAAANAADTTDTHVQTIVFEQLSGFNEDPAAISSPATATLAATINDKAQTITYKLTYSGFTSDVTQSHIHFGNRDASGGVAVFLCTNLANGPADTPACPQGNATVTGTLTAADVIGPTAQGIAAGDFNDLIAALRAGRTYVNIHTTNHPGGEIRAQIDNLS
jgi:hypothetical protein